MDNFDKDFRSIKRASIGIIIVNVILGVGIPAALIYIGVKVLQHFGIL